VRAASPLFEEAVLRQEITPQHVATVYQCWGDVFAYTCLVISVAVVPWAGARRRSATPARGA
jgi:apolipoprotein N-acyltransferase